ncbi:MAG: translation elongation factor-like protein [Candidatus Bathyarchaeota archaeon]|nr:translation elongation factor-like protein [Candidatus Bathyarchaeota archaeon]
MMNESEFMEVGNVMHYFTKAGVAVVELTDALSVGDRILIKGITTNVEQTVNSMQIEHVNISKAEAGQNVGLKVDGRVREGDTVYKVAV